MTWTVAEVRSVPCPRCKAPAGRGCKGKGERHHQVRVDAMVATRKGNRAKGGQKCPPLTQPVTIVGPLYREYMRTRPP